MGKYRQKTAKRLMSLVGSWRQRLTSFYKGWSSRQKKAFWVFTSLLFVWWFSLPRQLFNTPYALLLEDGNGQIIGARIAEDSQWRFPAPDSVPDKLAKAIVAFEDRRFWYHPGIDPLAMSRAMGQNVRAGAIVSGGSTLNMQVIRMAQGNPPRTFWRKAIEALLALRLEAGYSKRDILRLWATHAPFGGNVVGVEAASWRYFGKPPGLLSWAETATLAVLPNSPALIHPGKNREKLLKKRNRLLRRLRDDGHLDALSCQLAEAESLPDAPHPLPQLAPHLVDRAWKEYGPGRWKTTVQPDLQIRVTDIVNRRQRDLAANEVHNVAALVVDLQTGRTLAYVGNASDLGAQHSPWVDIITRPRSPGSLLKPLLLGLALEEGRLLPESLLPDAPIAFGGFRPENFYQDYNGAATARLALTRSLNVPFVHVLQDYGVDRFHYALQKWGFHQINQPAAHYGLSLILGGCEVTLWEAVGWYASLGRMVDHFYTYDGKYTPNDWQPPHYLFQDEENQGRIRLSKAPMLIGAGAGWQLLDIMQEVERPSSEGGWERFPGSRRVAWKTGTSYGFRDAWAVGITPRYAVGVWAGNADGEGRPGLVGVQAAAPVLFDIFNTLPHDGRGWFEPPHDAWRPARVCRESGYLASPTCPVDTQRMVKTARSIPVCSWHERIHTDLSGQWRVHAGCAPPEAIRTQAWFVLPPLQEHYYRRRHPGYRSLPPWRADCLPDDGEGQVMQMVYPTQFSRIFVPVGLDGRPSATIFSVAHRDAETTIYWHLDDQYLGHTKTFHSMELRPPPGKHRIVLTDKNGNRLEQAFVVVNEKGRALNN